MLKFSNWYKLILLNKNLKSKERKKQNVLEKKKLNISEKKRQNVLEKNKNALTKRESVRRKFD